MKTGKLLNPIPLIGCMAIALGIAAPMTSAETPFLILTDEEFDANLTYRERSADIVRKKPDPLAPRIIVEAPQLGSDVSPPVNIVVKFSPAADSAIVLDSLIVKYGWYDITERVRESMTVSPEGIAGQLQSMRRGKYTIKVTIGDTLQRTSNAEINFKIVDVSSKGSNKKAS
jgi:hypothetical protein